MWFSGTTTAGHIDQSNCHYLPPNNQQGLGLQSNFSNPSEFWRKMMNFLILQNCCPQSNFVPPLKKTSGSATEGQCTQICRVLWDTTTAGHINKNNCNSLPSKDYCPWIFRALLEIIKLYYIHEKRGLYNSVVVLDMIHTSNDEWSWPIKYLFTRNAHVKTLAKFMSPHTLQQLYCNDMNGIDIDASCESWSVWVTEANVLGSIIYERVNRLHICQGM
jgi:hypothetical protein